jgi:hypothetical protein
LEEPQTIPYREPIVIAVLGDRAALDMLHDQVGGTILEGSTVEDPGDSGVLQGSEDLPLVTKPPPRVGGVHAQAKELDRHLLVELAVLTLATKDDARTALTDSFCQPIGTDTITVPATGCEEQRLLHEVGVLIVPAEQSVNPATDLARQIGEEILARVALEGEGADKGIPDLDR